jgi:hypothetical protein
MKKLTFAIALLMLLSASYAQQKVSWSFSAKKLANNKYEIHIIGIPPSGWHIYSQLTPEGGPVPTSFKFNNNSLLAIEGRVVEKGRVITYFDENFKVNVKYFEGKADFVQVVSLRGNIKTNLSGEVESMICNDRTCMPPTTQKFNIALN